MKTIDELVYARIEELSDEGSALAEEGAFGEAIRRFEEALALVPEPKSDWETSTWLLTAIGDIAFQTGNYELAAEALRQAVACPGSLDNPFVRLRRGQTFFELGELDRAGEELAAAYMMEGGEIFEDEDPKYLAYLETLRRPPTGLVQ